MANVLFQWTRPAARTDGEAITGELYYRLYEDDVLVVDNILEPTFTLTNIENGTRVYTVTAVEGSLESAKSEPQTLNFIPPLAPTGLSITLQQG